MERLHALQENSENLVEKTTDYKNAAYKWQQQQKLKQQQQKDVETKTKNEETTKRSEVNSE